ncbi:polysaccharide deacetylase family protein [Bacillus sp. FJAT-47783]|uniref:polysaccharide deacetylase family protein n=1 Tax=Bacillus sp. FJAT-47783 TaxID=2922712 RepID=UPI001FABB642|nr:polysaccharide deacetylase family protein [Bacillus sp. FJAT-47783]
MLKKSMFIILIFFLFGCQSVEVKEEERAKDPRDVTEEAPLLEEKTKNEDRDELKVEGEEAEEVEKETYVVDDKTWMVKPSHKTDVTNVVLLTIDDAPDQYAVLMAETLKKFNTPAIFFVNGHFLQSDEERRQLKKIADLGFDIGNHTMGHPNLKKLSAEEQRDQIVELNDLIEEIIGERPRFFRAPFGVNTDTSMKVAEEEDMIVMNWTYGYDWEKDYLTKDSIAEIMVNTPLLKDGSILLMHDRQWTYEALQTIVSGLEGKGYTFLHPGQIVEK